MSTLLVIVDIAALSPYHTGTFPATGMVSDHVTENNGFWMRSCREVIENGLIYPATKKVVENLSWIYCKILQNATHFVKFIIMWSWKFYSQMFCIIYIKFNG